MKEQVPPLCTVCQASVHPQTYYQMQLDGGKEMPAIFVCGPECARVAYQAKQLQRGLLEIRETIEKVLGQAGFEKIFGR